MGLALTILFGIAMLLLIFSFVRMKQLAKKEKKEIDLVSIQLMEEINRLGNQVRNLELDAEIFAKEVGIQTDSSSKRVLLREVLDMHKRGYSLEGISAQKDLSIIEIQHLLSPYVSVDGRRNVANES
ncbi:hypothetical protein IM538_12210 [Cytobacillus suaedae]|nr:hypothetical protein IM538_12210 [Cytobacillus suaedae]